MSRSRDAADGPPATAAAVDRLGPAVVFRTEIPSRRARLGSWPSWADPVVLDRLAGVGISRPWGHQAEAAAAVWEGRDVVVATGTASGKSLAYQLPALTWARASAPGRRATCLYLAPTKALAADQAAALDRLAVPDVRVGVVDGDTSREQRDWSRRHAHLVLTNPDMLHRTVLPQHRRWRELLAGLQLVVLDECHHYRGVFGSHVAWVLRRLLRIAEAHGASPTVVLLSATSADPAETARTLLGRPALALTRDDSPAGPTDLLLADATAQVGSTAGVQPWAAALLATLTDAQARTLAFVRSRRGSEKVAGRAQRLLAEAGSTATVAAYRGGFLPEERRTLEADLRAGTLHGVATTNALELGIDLVGMDAVVVAGWPGTRAAFWQQVGRAGRDARPALAVFLAGDDPLEQYVVSHPDVLVGAPLERSVLDPANPYVMGPQLCAAAAELPWRHDEVTGPQMRHVLDGLAQDGRLRARRDGWFWSRHEAPSALVDIRGGGQAVRLVEQDTGRLLGTVDGARAPASVHPGAVYLHQGSVFAVTDLDLDEAVAFCVPATGEYETVSRSVSSVRVVSSQQDERWGEAQLVLGTVDVTTRVVAYQKRRPETGTVLADVPLDLPEQRLRTTGCWWTVPDGVLDGLAPGRRPGAAHAAEHASLGLLPLFATCDRWDVGGVSTACHPDTGRLTVVVHDAQPGGAGFAARGFAAAREWLAATRDLVAACSCAQGCPSCVQSPACGSGNAPLDKAGAVLLLSLLLDGPARA